ncbi:MAG TPA: hypothetical protein VLB90_06125 [Pseudomonadales bacterium]|nr:hypothetical protein [Pseudomonadales bacterium]
MTSSEQSTREVNSYESLFGYGHLRAHYLGSDMTTGSLHVTQFVRTEHLAILRDNLLIDRAILSHGSNTLLQRQITPVSRQCLWELQSGIMLRVLENITGLHNLLPDTHCKQTRLLLPPDTTGLHQWHTPDTRLDVALVVVIQLDNGNAQLCTNAQSLDTTSTGNASLQVSYWQHHPATTREVHS